MNIKEAIERGLYPKDEKGRSLVPMRNAGVATIYATDCPIPAYTIAGYDGRTVESWRDSGIYRDDGNESGLDLLPPPPRKVKVSKHVVMFKDGSCAGPYSSAAVAARENEHALGRGCRVVELTGEYEEPWS